jgi:hypothetical protein
MKIKLGLLNQGNGRFVGGFLIASLIFGGAATALGPLVSDNTPENGYLLCANTKTKAVTFPNKMSCPSGTKALDLGAVTGVEGPAGSSGQDGVDGKTGAPGPAGPVGKDATATAGYLVTLKEQDVIASVALKVERVLISKSGFKSGYYNLSSEVVTLFQSVNSQTILCLVKTSGTSYAHSGFPSHEVANTWTGHTVQLLGMVYVAANSDTISISCSFSGNARVLYGYMQLTPIVAPSILISD